MKSTVNNLDIIQLHHDILVAGYRERWKITELVMRNHWQSEVIKDVGKYMDRYQRMKNQTEASVEKLIINKVLERLWTHLIVGFIMKLLLVAIKNTILVMCDRLSKIMYFVATTEGMIAEGLARLFRNDVWKLHGLPESVILNRKPYFAVKLTKKLNRILDIKTKLLTLFHPLTDSQTK